MPAFGLPVPFLCLVIGLSFVWGCGVALHGAGPSRANLYRAAAIAAVPEAAGCTPAAFIASAFTPASNSGRWQLGF